GPGDPGRDGPRRAREERAGAPGAAREGARPDVRLRAGLILLVLVSLPGTASAAGSGGGVRISHHSAGESSRSIRHYWTPARVRGAEPRPLTVVNPGIAPPASPAKRASNPVYQVQDPDTPPNSANGKLIGHDSGGGYTCSATVVHSRNLDEILTAGHCVHTSEFGWARKLLFIPAYDR